MSLIEAVISGFVQGVTEFFPVSSSGHLVLLHSIFGISEPTMFFDICLHAGTLAAVLVYFRKDIYAIIRDKKIDWAAYIAIGTIPAVAAALFLEKKISLLFKDPGKVSYMFIVTAAILFAGHLSRRRRTGSDQDITWYNSLFAGAAQALALVPGVSRSGATISAGLAGGMKAETAFKFSFLLAVPAIAGAFVYEGLRGGGMASVSAIDRPWNYAAGAAVAFLTGLAVLPLLLKVVKTKRLYVFGIYCMFLGVSGILLWK